MNGGMGTHRPVVLVVDDELRSLEALRRTPWPCNRAARPMR